MKHNFNTIEEHFFGFYFEKQKFFIYRHAIQRQLAMNLELVRRGHTPTGVQQAVTELERRQRQQTEEEKKRQPKNKKYVVKFLPSQPLN